MGWLRDCIDPPKRLEQIREAEARRSAGQVATPRDHINWVAVLLVAGLQATLMAGWLARLLVLDGSLDDAGSWFQLAIVVTVPGFLTGAVVKSDRFLNGWLAAGIGSLLGFATMLVAGVTVPEPPGASADYGQAVGIGIAATSVFAVMLSPVAGAFSALTGQLHRHRRS